MAKPEEVDRFRRLRPRQSDDPEFQQAGEFAVPQVEYILDQVRTITNKFGILPPFPLLPQIPRRENDADAVARMPKLEEVKEVPKPEAPKPQINCPRCHSPSPVGTRYCSVCAWDLNMPYYFEKGYEMRR